MSVKTKNKQNMTFTSIMQPPYYLEQRGGEGDHQLREKLPLRHHDKHDPEEGHQYTIQLNTDEKQLMPDNRKIAVLDNATLPHPKSKMTLQSQQTLMKKCNLRMMKTQYTVELYRRKQIN
ncbi:hypothetical protein KSP39_PZI012813 [Platanthera zijinensis]|uniref:Uncharacterized protein n=1 Tax=Platanthera zijinensis TaxID=2320716 RepID=A0AAP0G4F7_9ASPA